MALLNSQIHAFLAVADCQSVSKAAIVLHLTQTAVTKRLQTLEQDIQAALFQRSHKGMELTDTGKQLYQFCLKFADQEQLLIEKFQEFGKTLPIEITIDGPHTYMQCLVVPQLIPVMKQYPHINFRIISVDSQYRHVALRQGDCDFALVVEKDLSKDLKTIPVRTEEYVLVCSRQWAKRDLQDIIDQETVIAFDLTDIDKVSTLDYLHYYGLRSSKPPRTIYRNDVSSMLALIENGIGYGVILSAAAKAPLAEGRLHLLNQGKSLKFPLYLVWHPHTVQTDYNTAIIKALSQP